MKWIVIEPSNAVPTPLPDLWTSVEHLKPDLVFWKIRLPDPSYPDILGITTAAMLLYDQSYVKPLETISLVQESRITRSATIKVFQTMDEDIAEPEKPLDCSTCSASGVSRYILETKDDVMNYLSGNFGISRFRFGVTCFLVKSLKGYSHFIDIKNTRYKNTKMLLLADSDLSDCSVVRDLINNGILVISIKDLDELKNGLCNANTNSIITVDFGNSKFHFDGKAYRCNRIPQIGTIVYDIFMNNGLLDYLTAINEEIRDCSTCELNF